LEIDSYLLRRKDQWEELERQGTPPSPVLDRIRRSTIGLAGDSEKRSLTEEFGPARQIETPRILPDATTPAIRQRPGSF
jgi:hypothetical protein